MHELTGRTHWHEPTGNNRAGFGEFGGGDELTRGLTPGQCSTQLLGDIRSRIEKRREVVLRQLVDRGGHQRADFCSGWSSRQHPDLPKMVARADPEHFDPGRATVNYLHFGDAGGFPAPVDPEDLYARSLKVSAFGLDERHDPPAAARARHDLVAWAADGSLRFRIGRTLPLTEAAEAHLERSEQPDAE